MFSAFQKAAASRNNDAGLQCLWFFELARVLVRFDHVAHIMEWCAVPWAARMRPNETEISL